MKKLIAFICISFSTFTSSLCIAQKHQIDSLLHKLQKDQSDSTKVKDLNALAFTFCRINSDSAILLAGQAGDLAKNLTWAKGEANAYRAAGYAYRAKGDFNKVIEYFLKALAINEQMGNKSGMASILANLGVAYKNLGNFPEALNYYFKSIELKKELGDTTSIAPTLSNIGVVYNMQGVYTKALDYDLKALKTDEATGDKNGIADDYDNISITYIDQHDYPKALEYDLKALKIDEELGSKNDIALVLGNIGIVYHDQGDYSKALDYCTQAMKIDEELGDKRSVAVNFGNIGNIYKDQKDYTKAADNYQQALAIYKELGYKNGIAAVLGNIGELYTKTGKFKEAEDYLKKAIALDDSIGEQNDLREFEESLSNLYDTTGRYQLSLVYYKKAMALKDTLFNIDKNKALTRKEMTYEFEKQQAAEKAAQDKKDALVDADKRKQKIIIWSIAGGLLLVLVFAGFIFRSLRITRKQKTLIEIQKTEVEQQKLLVEEKSKIVEEKNKDILDSITYAKRLQDAILPPLSMIEKYLPESFVLYKPKDIVAGDFYWMERAGDNILLAAADSTGHGVPGAMVSVVCSNALNRTVKEFKITEPGRILDKVRELVLETFEKSESNVQDGMDISLCCINTKTKETQWSGAYNSLWYIQNEELKEVPADKQPIGKNDKPLPFNTHNLKLAKGDTLYLFTDGYADQFGGPKGKKFKYKQLSDQLTVISDKPMEEQRQILNQTLEDWKGNLEQVDDVLIIGIRV